LDGLGHLKVDFVEPLQAVPVYAGVIDDLHSL
jgi:hypothetical protein